MSEGSAFTFLCTRCRERPAVVKRGRKVFLCASCASDVMWQDMVGAFMVEEVDQEPGPTVDQS